MRTVLESEQGTSIDATKSFIIYKPGEADLGWMDVEIRGVPDVFYNFRDYDVHMHVCYQMVNRIPDVINCASGLITLDRLPRPKYRAHPPALLFVWLSPYRASGSGEKHEGERSS